MTSEYAPGWPASAVTALAVLAVLLALVGTVISLVTTNTLLVGSSWTIPALVSVGVVVVTLTVVVLAGGPSDRWKRTTYW